MCCLHHRGVAAEARAGEHEGAAPDFLHRSVRPHERHAAHPVGAIGIHRRHVRGGEQVETRARRRALEGGHQRGAGLFRHRVHAQCAVAGVQEPLDQHERHAVRVGEPFERRARCAADGFDHARVRLVVILAPDVGDHQRERVGDASLPLPARLAGGNEPRRQGGRAGRRRVALEHEHLRARIARRQRGDEPAGARADDEHRRVQVESPQLVDHDRHPLLLRRRRARRRSRRPSRRAHCARSASRASR